jgi:hypothetical protein
MNTPEFADVSVQLMERYETSGADVLGEPEFEGMTVSTFCDAALPTSHEGVVLTLHNASEFRVTAVRSR